MNIPHTTIVNRPKEKRRKLGPYKWQYVPYLAYKHQSLGFSHRHQGNLPPTKSKQPETGYYD